MALNLCNGCTNSALLAYLQFILKSLSSSARFILPANANAIRMLTSQIRNEIRTELSCAQLSCEYRSERGVVTSNSRQFASHSQEV